MSKSQEVAADMLHMMQGACDAYMKIKNRGEALIRKIESTMSPEFHEGLPVVMWDESQQCIVNTSGRAIKAGEQFIISGDDLRKMFLQKDQQE